MNRTSERFGFLAYSIRWLNGLHQREVDLFEHCGPLTMVRFPMAIRAKSYDEVRIIRAAISQASDVVGLQIRRSIGAEKWRGTVAMLAIEPRSGKNIVSNVSASLKHVALHRHLAWRHTSRIHRTITKDGNVGCRFGVGLWIEVLDEQSLLNIQERPEFEDDCSTHDTISAGRFDNSVGLVNVFIKKTQFTIDFLKSQQCLSIGDVISDGQVAVAHLHGPSRALAKVVESTIVTKVVGISVCLSFFAGNDNDHRMVGRSDDSTLWLASEASMDIVAPVVRSAAFKAKWHLGFSSATSNAFNRWMHRRPTRRPCTDAGFGSLPCVFSLIFQKHSSAFGSWGVVRG